MSVLGHRLAHRSGRRAARSLAAGLAAFAALAAFAMGAADATAAPERDGRILSARFSHDDAGIPEQRPEWDDCAIGSAVDAIVLVFARQLQQATLDTEDFVVHTRLGEQRVPECAWQPEPDAELGDRTVWLVGELGDAERDPPLRVEVTGELLDERGSSLEGAAIEDIDGLSSGPRPVLAERLAEPAADCPRDARAQTLRITWSGSISREQGEVAGLSRESRVRPSRLEEALRRGIVGHVPRPEGRPRRVYPDAVVQIEDGDNMTTLCYAQPDAIAHVVVSPAIVTGPQDDWNAAGRLDVAEPE